MTDIKAQINSLQAQLKVAKEQEEAIAAQVRAQKAFEASSAIKTLQFLKDYLDVRILQGTLTSDVYFDIFRKYRKVYQDLDDQYAFFLSTVIKLISHPYHGVECSTTFIGNGGLKYMGKDYESKETLYHSLVVLTLVGEWADNDPFGTDIWFYELLQLHLADPTAFPAYVYSGEVKTRILPLMKRVVKAQQESLVLPDLAELTEADALFLHGLTGI